jgi:O-antigen/teichoic acid export membrane protein
MATYVVYTIANNLTPNLIARYFNFREAGYYYQASKWYNKPVLFVTTPIGAVSLPVISKVNDDKERQKRVFRKMVKTMAFVALPLSIFFTYIIPEFVRVFLPDWLDVIPYMQLLCLGAIFVPMDTLYFNLFNSQGKSGALFVFTLIKSILIIIGLFISIKSGVFALIIAIGIVNYMFFGLMSIYSMKLIDYKVREWIKDIFPYLIIPVAIVAILYYILPGIENRYLALLFKGGISVIFYTLIMYLGKSEIMMECVGYIQRFIHRKFGNK